MALRTARLKGAGFPLLPLGGADGKAPLLRWPDIFGANPGPYVTGKIDH